MFSAGAVFFTNFTPWNDPLAWRSFSHGNAMMLMLHSINPLGDFSNHHFLNLVAEAGFCFVIAGYFASRLNQSYWRMGFLATYAAVLVWTVHEGYWWVTYWGLWHGFNPVFLDKLSGMGELITLALLVFTLTMRFYAPWRYCLVMLGFYAVWIGVGFPITESYVGNTPLYGTVWGDGWEVGSWVFSVVSFYILERKGMLRWFEKVKEVLTYGQTNVTKL